MRKILYFFITLLIISGCKKSSFVSDFDQTPEDRMATSIALVSNTLTSASNGWVATLSTSAGGGFGFYMTFDNQQNVSMYADLTDDASITSANSTYRVKTGLGADLIFDTYNYLSMLADPNASAFGGTQPTGFKSDVEFTYVRSSADSIVFIGKQYRQLLKMVKATAAQKATYTAGGYKTAINKVKDYFAAVKYPYIEITSGSAVLKVGLSVNTSSGLASGKRGTLTGVLADGVSTASGTGKFAFNLTGADFVGSDFVYQGITFVRLAWKDAATLALYDSTGKEYILKSNPVPLTPLALLYGFPTTYTYRKIMIGGTSPVAGGALLPSGVTSQFNTVYQAMVTRLAALSPARTIVGISFTLTGNSTAILNVSPNNGTSTFSANATFSYSITDGVITLTKPIYDSNWTARGTEYDGIKNFFLSGPFKIDWVTSTNPSSPLLGGLYRVADATSFFYGTL
ncbi:hypothetical protein DBR40_14945 [Pedobacter sp. KBW01]|uniref:DUF4302 domain-containing protein n=1 Tax=Pedobacter sp. KBW01 TaxID=2153364 RepID=UPI000F59AA36|nr:DUF4302 domain-containing protein [Pedobacter sp. KBW01]RQO72602.1 hypothetical protein DBR40_14945 [Pedobacter sp. KBW01]